jgi:hypothetical protein
VKRGTAWLSILDFPAIAHSLPPEYTGSAMSENQEILPDLMARLKRFHPRHETELTLIELLMQEKGVTSEGFEERLKMIRAMTNRL